MTLKISKRSAIAPFIVMDVLQRANKRQNKKGDVLHLELGQPSVGAPVGALEAAHQALNSANLGYTDAFGLLSLRHRISAWYDSEYKVDVPVSRIFVTTGSSGAFVLAFLSAFDDGDKVALVNPGYPGYRNILMALNVQPIFFTCSHEDNYRLFPEILSQDSEKIDGLILASPSNPTGTMISPLDFQKISDICTERRIRLISDEIYHGICFKNAPQTALKYSSDAIAIGSFSKFFCMTGWRVGWMVIPEELVRPVERLAQNLYISAPTLSQIAAEAAFKCREELDRNVETYKRNRKILLAGLSQIGLTKCSPVDGAFYVYVDIGDFSDNSSDFSQSLLNATGVAITPGLDFDQSRGNRFVRLSFSGETGTIERAIDRIGNWFSSFR